VLLLSEKNAAKESKMKISNLLEENCVELNLKSKTREQALRELVSILHRAKKIKNPDKLFETLISKGNTTRYTYLDRVAIPHALFDGIDEAVACFATFMPGVDFEAEGQQSVQIVFLFLSPIGESETHLQILSKAEGLFQNKKLCDAFLRTHTRKRVITGILTAERMGWDSYINLSEEEVLSELETSEAGLSEKEAIRRLDLYGPNILEKIGRKSLLVRFWRNLTNLFAVLLWVAGVLAFIANIPELGFAIIAVIIINAVFSFWQEYKAEKAVEALRQLIPSYSRVFRDGEEIKITTSDIVPGDIILLGEGDRIPADGRLFEAFDMRVDNSALTGESRPIYKISESLMDGKNFIWSELPNLVFGGTSVLSGTGKAIVIATGMHSEIGKIARLTQVIKEELSPLQRELINVTKVITVIAICMGIAFFMLGNYVANLTTLQSFIFAIGIIVANVPEGLLPTVSLALAMAVQRMVRRNVVIKRLSSVETLGCTSVICTDKTGTLTTNQVSVVKLWFDNEVFEATGAGYDPRGEILRNASQLSEGELSSAGFELIFNICSLCNNAELNAPSAGKPYWNVSGDPTEGALLAFARKAGFDYSEIKGRNPRIFQLSFDSVRKRMSTINEHAGNKIIANVKGAPRELLALCKSVFIDGSRQELTDEVKSSIMKNLDHFAADGLRVLGLAYKEVDKKDTYTIEEVETDLTFVGLTGMMDPPRPEVPEAVSLCHSAGIKVIMITGDYGLTALSIAKRIGLAKDETARVITGYEISEMTDTELTELLKGRDVIFARVSPEHKMRIVDTLKDMGEVVAVTGDGVNDAPALKRADVGVAMGLRGTDVAKEAATMIITDDNFATIVAGIEEGRAIYSNIKKFVTYIFASNIPEIVPFILFVLFKIPLPLTIMQILAVDLGTDLVPALGLGAETSEPGVMNQPPRSLRKRLLDLPLLLRAYGFLGMIEATACMAGYFFVYYASGWRPGTELASSGPVYLKATTMCLAGIVAAQIGNVYACRTERESVFKIGFSANRLILFGILSEIILIMVIVYFEPMQKIFNTSSLSLVDWIVLSSFIPIIFFAEEFRKFVIRYRDRSDNSGKNN
jgi:Ca2+-transporting ATPase